MIIKTLDRFQKKLTQTTKGPKKIQIGYFVHEKSVPPRFRGNHCVVFNPIQTETLTKSLQVSCLYMNADWKRVFVSGVRTDGVEKCSMMHQHAHAPANLIQDVIPQSYRTNLEECSGPCLSINFLKIERESTERISRKNGKARQKRRFCPVLCRILASILDQFLFLRYILTKTRLNRNLRLHSGLIGI